MLVQTFQKMLEQYNEKSDLFSTLDRLVAKNNKLGFLDKLKKYYQTGTPYSFEFLILMNGMLFEHFYQSMLNTPIENTELGIVGSGFRAAIYKQTFGDSVNTYEISRYALSVWMQSYFDSNLIPYGDQLLVHPDEAYQWIRSGQSNDRYLASPVIAIGILASHFFYGRNSTFLNTKITKIEYEPNEDFPLKVFYTRDDDGVPKIVRHKQLLFTIGLGQQEFPTNDPIFMAQSELSPDDPDKIFFSLGEFLPAPMVTSSIVERAILKKIQLREKSINITLVGGNHGSAIIAEGLVKAIDELRKVPIYKDFEIKVNWVGLPNAKWNTSQVITKNILQQTWIFTDRYKNIIDRMFDTGDPNFTFKLSTNRIEKIDATGSKVTLRNGSQQQIITSDFLFYAVGYRGNKVNKLFEDSINTVFGADGAITVSYDNWTRLQTTNAPVTSVRQVVVTKRNGEQVELPIYFD